MSRTPWVQMAKKIAYRANRLPAVAPSTFPSIFASSHGLLGLPSRKFDGVNTATATSRKRRPYAPPSDNRLRRAYSGSYALLRRKERQRKKRSIEEADKKRGRCKKLGLERGSRLVRWSRMLFPVSPLPPYPLFFPESRRDNQSVGHLDARIRWLRRCAECDFPRRQLPPHLRPTFPENPPEARASAKGGG